MSFWEHSVEMLNCLGRMSREKIIEKNYRKNERKDQKNYLERNGKLENIIQKDTKN